MSDYDKVMFCPTCDCDQPHNISGSGNKRTCMNCHTRSKRIMTPSAEWVEVTGYDDFHDMLDEMLAFHNLQPSEPVEHNVGSVWFRDLDTGTTYYITIGECEE